MHFEGVGLKERLCHSSTEFKLVKKKKKNRVVRNAEDGQDDVHGSQTYRLRIALGVTDQHCGVLGQVALGRNLTSFDFAPGGVC